MAIAKAEVHLKDASFIKTETDVITSRYKIERVYNSRSLHKGLWGFGWCTALEAKLYIFNERMTLVDCQNEVNQVFTKKHKAYYLTASKDDFILPQKNIYLRFRKGSLIQKFDAMGRLIARFHVNKAKDRFDLSYGSSGDLVKIRLNGHIELKVDSKNGRVERLRGPRTAHFLYTYDQGNLVQVTYQEKFLTIYTYDAFHNLTVIQSSEKSEVITYDGLRDWVTAYQNSQGCKETYFYSHDPTRNESTTRQAKSCPQQQQENSSFIFSYRLRTDGLTYLHQVKSQMKGKITLWTLDPSTGQILKSAHTFSPEF